MSERIRQAPHLWVTQYEITKSILSRKVSGQNVRAMEMLLDDLTDKIDPNSRVLYPIKGTPYLIRKCPAPEHGLHLDFYLSPGNGAPPSPLVSLFVIPNANAMRELLPHLRGVAPHTFPEMKTFPLCMSLRVKGRFPLSAKLSILCQSAVFMWLDRFFTPSPKTPNELLQQVLIDFPKFHKPVSEAFLNRPDKLSKNVFLDSDAWRALAFKEYGLTSPSGLRSYPHLSELTSAGTWSYTKSIYRFDATLVEELAKSSLKGEIPSDILQRLPEYCVYIEMPKGFKHPAFKGTLFGFFVSFDDHDNHLLMEAQPLADPPTGSCQIRLSGLSIEEEVELHCQKMMALKKTTQKRLDEVKADYIERLRFFVNCALYLCSDEPEIAGVAPGAYHPAKPTPKKTKKGVELFPAQKTRVFTVGEKLGALIRTYKNAEDHHDAEGNAKTRASPRPHIRAAHWTLYHVGAGRKESRLRWIPPLVIAAEK